MASLLTVMVVAKLAGADNPRHIADWVAERAEFPARVFELKRPAMPHHNTCRRVLQRVVDADQLERLLAIVRRQWAIGRGHPTRRRPAEENEKALGAPPTPTGLPESCCYNPRS